MSDVQTSDDHPTDAHGATAASDDPHGAGVEGGGDHGAGHGPDHHGHLDEPLGPVDAAAWGVGVLGVAIGLTTAFCFALTTGLLVV